MAVVASAVMMLMGVGMARAEEAQAVGKAEGQTVKKQTVCPIMGGQVNTNLYVDANGKRVYFCCGGCPAAFKKDPAKYIAKMENDGITLDQAPAADPTKKQTTDAATAPVKGCDKATVKGEACCN